MARFDQPSSTNCARVTTPCCREANRATARSGGGGPSNAPYGWLRRPTPQWWPAACDAWVTSVTLQRLERNLFVTGLAGYLGAEVARRAAAEGWRVSGTTYQRPAAPEISGHRMDVRDGAAVRAALEAERPDAVVHTAYDRHAEDVTADGARVVAEAAAHAGARLIHMSSDLVFGGQLGRPLSEE